MNGRTGRGVEWGGAEFAMKRSGFTLVEILVDPVNSGFRMADSGCGVLPTTPGPDTGSVVIRSDIGNRESGISPFRSAGPVRHFPGTGTGRENLHQRKCWTCPPGRAYTGGLRDS